MRACVHLCCACAFELDVRVSVHAEKYTRGVSAVESILTLDRLRQNVAIKELEQTHGQPLSMRKTVSVPNFSQVSDGDGGCGFSIFHIREGDNQVCCLCSEMIGMCVRIAVNHR